MQDNEYEYISLNELEKLELRNLLLAEYLPSGQRLMEHLETDLQIMIDTEAFEAAAMYRDLITDLNELDNLYSN